MKSNFCELHFRGRSTLHKINEIYLFDHLRQPQCGQNSILACSKAKIRIWNIISDIFNIYVPNPFSLTRDEGEIIFGPEVEGTPVSGTGVKYIRNRGLKSAHAL